MLKPFEVSASVVRDALLRLVYAGGWRLAVRIPAPLVRVIIGAGARLAVRHHGSHLCTLRQNLAIATGSVVDDRLLRAAAASYLRNFYEVLALPAWSGSEVVRRVLTVNEEVLRTAYAGPGAVVALPHSGNWDLAGAWAGRTGMPVTTVAEQLGRAEFAAFVAFRESLGMEVLSHRDPALMGALMDAVRRGRLVCLVADRDLAGAGVAVSWAGRRITMPAGPAILARRTGAALIPAVCQFTDQQMVITFGEAVTAQPGRDGLVTMTQRVADFFASTIARQPADWHMMQPFFAADPKLS